MSAEREYATLVDQLLELHKGCTPGPAGECLIHGPDLVGGALCIALDEVRAHRSWMARNVCQAPPPEDELGDELCGLPKEHEGDHFDGEYSWS